MSVLYYVWALLPLTFFLLVLWGLVRPYLGYRGTDHLRSHCKQGLYCSIALAAAIGIDQTAFFAAAVEAASFGMLDFNIARWLLYPGVLLLMATAQSIILKENKQRRLPSRYSYR